MRRLLAVALLLTAPLLANPAIAQRAGAYVVEGSGADGSRYTGAAQIAPSGPQTWLVTWRVGGETIQGIGVDNGSVLSVAYNQGGVLGSALYEVRPDGSLVGLWTSGRDGGLGRETMSPR
ncbi:MULTISPECIES: hypothetical protein [Roseomonadaceae]|uniref:Uncharacterized protein n=1 Tax=Falsiroseomonas oleicola TaxID=2801474 RepID=A0ABS6H1B0_9PROT|nr:hypothetical protein [Roseomonas oleicola]MBU8542424.1 hypothetical protein [Roseomonas oleicola]